MSPDPVTAIANAVSEAFGTAKPFVQDFIRQKYENEFKERLVQWNDILSEKDGNRRADRMHSYVMRLLAHAGETAGSMGENVGVPLDFLSALISVACSKIKNDHLIANINYK